MYSRISPYIGKMGDEAWNILRKENMRLLIYGNVPFLSSMMRKLAMLSESHISIHTYPEKGFCGMDCYTCGASIDSDAAVTYLVRRLSPSTLHRKLLQRRSGEILETEGVSECTY